MAIYAGETRLSGNISSLQVTSEIDKHNVSGEAHQDIRDAIPTNADDIKAIEAGKAGNASQVLFGDGTSFQAKLDSGELKGEDGANGAQGIQGIPGATGATGAKGADGLTTQVTVNGSTYTQVGGTISLPAYTLPVKYKTGADFTVAELAEGQLGVVY